VDQSGGLLAIEQLSVTQPLDRVRPWRKGTERYAPNERTAGPHRDETGSRDWFKVLAPITRPLGRRPINDLAQSGLVCHLSSSPIFAANGGRKGRGDEGAPSPVPKLHRRVDGLRIGPRVLGLVERRHLSALECPHLGADARIGEVEHSKETLFNFHHRLHTNGAVREPLGEVRQRAELGACVGEVVAVGVDDRGGQRALRPSDRPRIHRVGGTDLPTRMRHCRLRLRRRLPRASGFPSIGKWAGLLAGEATIGVQSDSTVLTGGPLDRRSTHLPALLVGDGAADGRARAERRTAVLGLLDVPEVSRHDPDRGGSSRARLRTRVVGGWKFGAGGVRGAEAAAG